ncbi:MAG: helix-turn-helix domain-containing protein [Chloroflexi bacterium]|nr:helix-turn-helix domain-containing protein [Chloroflexota bacterium]
MTQDRKPRVALLAAPETSASVLYGLYDVLLSVGAVFPDMTTGTPGDAALDVLIVAASREPFRCFGNILVEPHAAVADVDQVDVAIVCDMYTPIDLPPKGRYAAEIAWLRRMHRRGATIATVCTGSLLLAESGLLDGRSCAGHWAYRELYRFAYPTVRFQPGAILDRSSEDDGLLTAGGVTAWHELALHLISRFCGAEEASRTAKFYLLAGHEDGQLPFSAMTRQRPLGDAPIRASLAWIDDQYALPNPVTAMIGRSGLTKRTFARRFWAATGHRPIDYVHALRIERARKHLERGDRAIDDVGFDVGYEDPTFFRRLFKRTTGLTPAAYRRKYAQIASAG